MNKATMIACLSATAATAISQAAVVLSTDFSGVTDSAATASNITWTQNNLSLASGDLVYTAETGGGFGSIILRTTGTNANRVGVNYNVETGGGRSWSTQFTFTTTEILDLTDFNVDFHAISGGGSNQNSVTKNGDFTFQLYQGTGTGGTQLFNGTEDNLAESSPAAGAEASYDLSGLANIAPGTYTGYILVERGSETLGNNWAMDDIVLNADVVPEPSTAALLGLGGFALILRRRK